MSGNDRYNARHYISPAFSLGNRKNVLPGNFVPYPYITAEYFKSFIEKRERFLIGLLLSGSYKDSNNFYNMAGELRSLNGQFLDLIYQSTIDEEEFFLLKQEYQIMVNQ